MIDWAKVKEELQNELGLVKFSLDGCEIEVIHIARTVGLTKKGALSVYIDGSIKGAWDEKNMPIITKVWCTVTKPLFSRKEKEKHKEEYRKIYGKRVLSEKENEYINKTYTMTNWWFDSLAKFIKQYKELEKDGLKLAKGFEEFEKQKKGLFDE